MTPSQRKKNLDNAWRVVAGAPRKSYLGKGRKLTPVQNRWVRSLLSVWGETFGGSTCYFLSGGGGMWGRIVQEEWNDDQMERFGCVFTQMRELGYCGEELIKKSAEILWPKKSLNSILARADNKEQADFIEKAILKAFSISSPIYIFGKMYYTGIDSNYTNMGDKLRERYAPFLTKKQSEDRVRWCIDLFNTAAFDAINAEIRAERALNFQKKLENE